MRLKLHYSIILCYSVTLLFIISCGKIKKDQGEELVTEDSLAIPPDRNTTQKVGQTKEVSKDRLTEAVKKVVQDFAEYKPQSTYWIDTITDISKHWFFVTLDGQRKRLETSNGERSHKQLLNLPTRSEMDMVSSVRQGGLYRYKPNTSDILLEEWNFSTANDAERWFVLMSDSLRNNIYTKPPQFQWVEGSKLFLVAVRSAGEWFELSDSLIFKLSGKTRTQLSTIYDPMDLKHFKKWRGPANSGIVDPKPYLYTDSAQQHYDYFYFVKQRLTGEARRKYNSEFPSRQSFRITTSLHIPFTGDENYYTIEETLVALQCAIDEPALGKLNLVGKSPEYLKKQLGDALYENDELKIFGHANRVVVTKSEDGKVSVFKYLRLKALFSSLKNDNKFIDEISRFR